MDSSPDKFRTQIREAWSELYSLETAQRVIEKRVEDMRGLIRASANFLPTDERIMEHALLDLVKHPTNITEAVKLSLFVAYQKKQRLTPIQIRENAEQRGFNFTEYTNPMASIHTILRRMKEAVPPEVDFDENSGTYLLANALSPSMISPAVMDKVKRDTMETVVKRATQKRLNPDRIRALFDEVSSEIIDETLTKTLRRPSEE